MQYRRQKAKYSLTFFLSFNVVLSITVALLILGLSALLILQSHQFARFMRDNLEVEVFLQKDCSPKQRQTLIQQIKKQAYYQANGKIKFISKEEAARSFMRETQEDFVAFLGENPLRDALIFRVNSTYQLADSIQQIKNSLEQFPQVYEVSYVENILASINHNTQRILLVLLLFGSFAIFTVLILIDNTIRLALFSQRFLIRTMQLVGARPAFIRSPFLQEAFWRGALSALFANALLSLLLWYLAVQIPEIRLLYRVDYFIILALLLFLLGTGLATWSTYRAVSKYLRQPLDELY